MDSCQIVANQSVDSRRVWARLEVLVRVMMQNPEALFGDWPRRREVLAAGFRQVRPDLVAFVEAIVTSEYDQPRDLLGSDYYVVHQAARGSNGGGITIAHYRQPLAESWQLPLEFERQAQAVVSARFIEDLAGDRQVVLTGDFDATPDATSMRFWRGLHALDGLSVCYRDA